MYEPCTDIHANEPIKLIINCFCYCGFLRQDCRIFGLRLTNKNTIHFENRKFYSKWAAVQVHLFTNPTVYTNCICHCSCIHFIWGQEKIERNNQSSFLIIVYRFSDGANLMKEEFGGSFVWSISFSAFPSVECTDGCDLSSSVEEPGPWWNSWCNLPLRKSLTKFFNLPGLKISL